MDGMLALIAGAAAELTVGDPRDPATDVGPVIDREAKDKLDAHVARWAAKGRVRHQGRLPAGTLANGTYVAPTIIELPSAADLTEEVFGPCCTWCGGRRRSWSA